MFNVFELMFMFMFNVLELGILNVLEVEKYWYLIFILMFNVLMFDYVWNGRKKIKFDSNKYIGSIWQFFKRKSKKKKYSI